MPISSLHITNTCIHKVHMSHLDTHTHTLIHPFIKDMSCDQMGHANGSRDSDPNPQALSQEPRELKCILE